jgi:hypothetical protein
MGLPIGGLRCGEIPRARPDKGNFVRDLSRDDFEVLEDGLPQTISELSLIDLSERSKQPPATVPSSGVLANSDLEKLDGGFIKDRMMPGDAAAVVIASGAARQDFTHDKQMLLKAVDRFTGTLDAGEPASQKQQRARRRPARDRSGRRARTASSARAARITCWPIALPTTNQTANIGAQRSK